LQSKLDCNDLHQLTQRIVLCMRDALEDPEAAAKPLMEDRRGKEKQP